VLHIIIARGIQGSQHKWPACESCAVWPDMHASLMPWCGGTRHHVTAVHLRPACSLLLSCIHHSLLFTHLQLNGHTLKRHIQRLLHRHHGRSPSPAPQQHHQHAQQHKQSTGSSQQGPGTSHHHQQQQGGGRVEPQMAGTCRRLLDQHMKVMLLACCSGKAWGAGGE
jgi:hypothetical protein